MLSRYTATTQLVRWYALWPQVARDRDKCIIVFVASSHASRQRWWRRRWWWWSQLLLEPNGRQMLLFLSFTLAPSLRSFTHFWRAIFHVFPSVWLLLCHSISRNRSASELTCCSCVAWLACMFIQFIFMLQHLVFSASSILSRLYI